MMPPRTKVAPSTLNKDEVLAWLEKKGTQRAIDELARYGIEARHAFGVPMKTLLALAKQLGTNHDLASALWDSGWYEARLVASLIGDPQRVTRRQMDAWAAGFENWGDCDTVCFKLFDRTPFALEKACKWSTSPREFVKRGGFVLMACFALHDKAAPDEDLLPLLPLIEEGARDERNFVKKGVLWALRAVGERNAKLHAPSLALAQRLALSEEAPARWVGKAALREWTSAKVTARLARRFAHVPD
jgi:3-methyladenine DNA glycosylase AlkD